MVNEGISVEGGPNIATQVRHDLLHKLQYLLVITIHVNPVNASGGKHHHIEEHAYSSEPAHSHQTKFMLKRGAHVCA